MAIVDSIIENLLSRDFNAKMDKLRADLSEMLIKEVNKTLPSTNAINLINDQINRMEVARRVFNNYLDTGKVELPD